MGYRSPLNFMDPPFEERPFTVEIRLYRIGQKTSKGRRSSTSRRDVFKTWSVRVGGRTSSTYFRRNA
jgi:hypothetical protein